MSVSEKRIPAVFLLPSGRREPIDIEFRHEALRMSVVDRQDTESLADWNVVGIYLLFSGSDDTEPGTYSVYVGKAGPGAIADRIRRHRRNREGWTRALLVRRTTSDGFNSMEVAYLEKALHEVLNGARRAELTNDTTPPGDPTLAAHDRAAMDRVVSAVLAVMRAIGHDPDPAEATGTDPRVGRTAESRSPLGPRIHELLEQVPPGKWTSYGDLAEALDTNARAVGSHVRSCGLPGTAEWRILDRHGASRPGFRWSDREMRGISQVDRLRQEGVRFREVDGELRADPAQRVRAVDLVRAGG